MGGQCFKNMASMKMKLRMIMVIIIKKMKIRLIGTGQLENPILEQTVDNFKDSHNHSTN